MKSDSKWLAGLVRGVGHARGGGSLPMENSSGTACAFQPGLAGGIGSVVKAYNCSVKVMEAHLYIYKHMKTSLVRLTLTALLIASNPAVWAADTSDSATRIGVQSALFGLTPSDAVKTSASLVAAARESDRMRVASDALSVLAHSYASALPEVAGAIAVKSPELAGFVAADAVKLRPDLAVRITEATVTARAEQAGVIVESILYQNPSLYQTVGLAAMNAAPDKTRDILRAVSLTTLDLKANIDQALAAKPNLSSTEGRTILLRGIKTAKASTLYQPQDMAGGQVAAKNSDFGVTTASSVKTASGQASVGSLSPNFMPPPTFSAPPVPLPAVPIEIGVSDTTTKPGGRDYSAP